MKVLAKIQQLLLLALVAGTAHDVLCSSTSLYGNETDRLSLLDFKDAISLDPQQVFMSWNDSTHFCNWEGVMCRVKTPPLRVTSLNLTNRGLVGHISPSLGNLTFLQSLNLARNALTGEIPPSIGHMRRLKSIRLYINNLEGNIPSFTNSSNLKVLNVGYNNLVGKFPADFPPSLDMLHIPANNFTGTIPVSLANITTLIMINFQENHIMGNIPGEFTDLANLEYLFASENQLVDGFPQAILNLSTLIGLDLVLNGLTGEVPTNLCTCLPNLQELSLAGNFFVGYIPSSLANASILSSIDLGGNNFTGLVPPSIGKLTKLSYLGLEENQIQAHGRVEWEFLDSLGNCTELQILTLDYNRLSGHVPNSLGNLSNQLQELYLAHNSLSGDFPSGIENLHNLILVSLSMNNFIGVLPEWIGSLNTLQGIFLHTNFFTGSIPSTLSNLSRLASLYLYSNQLTGNIPPSFGNFPMLQKLAISYNNLHGRVPVGIFRIPTIFAIYLSFNNLDGELPTTIGNAKQLVTLVLSSNKLSGYIPNTLGDCQSIEDIELNSNIFSGSIPTSIGNITSLKILNLSTNKLTGTIPTSLGSLQLLEKLDLSLNYLSGEVPTKGIFKNATAVRIDGNQGLCGGVMDLHILACAVMPSNLTRRKKSTVLKKVVPIASVVLLAMVIFASLIRRGKPKSKEIALPLFSTKFPQVSFNDLARATQGFSTSNLIGRGRYSSVYQGKLVEEENQVAIKVFNLEIRGAQKSFIAECNALRNVRHRNLVPILTACSSIDSNGNDFKALLFELMPQGDLYKLLYSTQDYEGSSVLILITMAQRIRIVVDIADALEYLHHNNQGTIIHCDVKPSNILLDDNMTAHIGDFGLSRFKVICTTPSFGNSNSTSIGVMGTIGYAAPEYAGGGQVSTAADVYSFGVVLLEIFLRRKPIDDMFKDGLSIAKFIEINFPDRILEIVDAQLIQELELCQDTTSALKEKGVRSLLSMVDIGLSCTKPSPSERMNMHEVAAKLHGIKDAYFSSN